MMVRSILSMLGVVTALYGSVARAETPRVVLPGTSAVTPFPGHDSTLLSPHTATPSGAAVLELSIPPRTFGAPPHVHSNEDEHFYVLEGAVEFLERERTITAGPGSLVVLPRGHLHAFWNASDESARLLLVVTPGQFASFFDEVVARIRESHPSDSLAVGKIIAEIAARHGVEILPEKVPSSARELLPK